MTTLLGAKYLTNQPTNQFVSEDDRMIKIRILKRANKVTNRHGAMLPLMALVLVSLLTFIAFSINTSWMQLSKTRAQSAADLASASALTYFSDNAGRSHGTRVRGAIKVGAKILAQNENTPGAAGSSRINLGYLAGEVQHNPDFVLDKRQVSAVKIGADSSSSSEVPVFFGELLGRETIRITAESISSIEPIEVVLCLDASRSMNRLANGRRAPNGNNVPPAEGSRWFALIDTVDLFLNEVRSRSPRTRVSLVTFGGGLRAGRVSSPLDADHVRRELPFHLVDSTEIVDKLKSYTEFPALGFGTFIFDAIEESTDVLLETGNPRAKRFIILLSDGRQFTGRNRRADPRPAPVVATSRAVAMGIPIHTINYQRVANEELLEVARATGGDALDASDEDQLRNAFEVLLEKFRVRLAD